MAYPAPPGTAAPYSAPPTSGGSRSDIEGVSNLSLGSILGLVSQLMIWTGFALIYLIYTALTNSTSAFGGVTSLPGWITVNTFYLTFGLLSIGLLVGIVSYIFFYLGFRAIKRGAPDFGAPTALVFVGLIGYLMTVAGLLVIVGTIVSAINSAAAGTVSAGSASLDFSAIVSGLALIGLGGLLGLIGVIGLILGNWRAGNRYGESMVKIGAILTIIPFLSIIAYVLLLVGYMKAGRKLKTGWAPAMPGWGGPVSGPGYNQPMGAPAPAWGTPPPAGSPPAQSWQSPPPPPR
jgi:hypothetical protein